MALAFLLTLSQVVSAGCQRLDGSLPAQYIRYDSLGELATRGESRYRILLRLHNNSSCPVYYSEHGDQSQPGRHRIKYYLATNDADVRPGLQSDDLAIHQLAAGAAMVFDVPQYHLALQRILLVPVWYEWEEPSRDVWSAKHVTFDVSQIPEEARRRLKR
jgi:hypothetical protein